MFLLVLMVRQELHSCTGLMRRTLPLTSKINFSRSTQWAMARSTYASWSLTVFTLLPSAVMEKRPKVASGIHRQPRRFLSLPIVSAKSIVIPFARKLRGLRSETEGKAVLDTCTTTGLTAHVHSAASPWAYSCRVAAQRSTPKTVTIPKITSNRPVTVQTLQQQQSTIPSFHQWPRRLNG
jgi:hypothetical protein